MRLCLHVLLILNSPHYPVHDFQQLTKHLIAVLAASCMENHSKYYLQGREVLSDVATNCSVAVDTLLAADPQIVDKDVVFEGQPVCVPQECCTDQRVVCSSSPAASPKARGADAGDCCPGGGWGGGAEEIGRASCRERVSVGV